MGFVKESVIAFVFRNYNKSEFKSCKLTLFRMFVVVFSKFIVNGNNLEVKRNNSIFVIIRTHSSSIQIHKSHSIKM